MGYMGFGMRKEVYKRKPKKSFKKLKEIYGNNTPIVKHNPNAPKLTTEDVLNKPRFRSIHDTKFFQLAKVAIIFLLICVFLNFAFIQPWLFVRRMEAFKESLINSYSDDHQFLLNSGEHLNLQYFEFDSLNRSLITATKGFRFSGSGWHINRPEVVRIGTWNSDAIDVDVSNEKLIVHRKDSIQTLDKWVLIYKSSNTNSQYQKILHQLSIDTNYVAQVRSKLRSSKIREVKCEDSITSLKVASSKDFGTYELIRSEKALKENQNLIKVDDLTYLKKKY